MKGFAITLCCLYFVLDGYTRFWLVKPIESRPIGHRSNDTLEMISLLAMLGLLGGFFILLVICALPQPAWGVLGAALAYALGIREALFEKEVTRVRQSMRCGRRLAIRHVQVRAGNRKLSGISSWFEARSYGND